MLTQARLQLSVPAAIWRTTLILDVKIADLDSYGIYQQLRTSFRKFAKVSEQCSKATDLQAMISGKGL